MKFAVVIPALNEEKRIEKVIKETRKFCRNLIIVDDGSTDKTKAVCQKLNVTVLNHKVNLGKGAALKTGCDYAFRNNSDFIIAIDSDGQHNPLHIPKFIKAIKNGNDIVFGIRDIEKNSPATRLVGNKIASLLVRIFFGLVLSDILCGYRALTKKAYRKIAWSSRGYGVETEMVAKTGLRRLKYTTVSVESIYIDKYKGVSLLDAFIILKDFIIWRISEK